jgi:tetratricopeptide (TPR) repeat protein
MRKKLVVLLLIAAGACTAASASPDQWVEVSSAHFSVLTNSNEKQARHVLDQFERMRWVFQTLFPKLNADPPTPIMVYAAKNAKTFQALVPQAYLAKGALPLAGYFLTSQDGNYILLRMDAEEEKHPFATVYHEYTHLQLRSAGEWMPLWLNEGLAEFFQNTTVKDKEVLIGEPSEDDLLYLRQQRLIPLPVLFQVNADSPYYHQEQKGSVFYAEAWALTHFLEITDRENKTNRLPTYVNLMAHHEDSVVASGKAFGDLKQLQNALESYIRSAQYKAFIMHSAAAPIDESSYVAKAITQTEADLERADILSLVHREQEARDLTQSILKADPKNVKALETMGSIELRARNQDAARKWYSEAVKLDSKSFEANYYFARLSMETEGSADSAIESSYRTAVELNAKYAPAYDGLASYYARNHTKLDEAYALESNAVKLDPGNFYFRMNAANLAAEMGHYDDSAAILQAAIKLARSPVETGMAQSRIDSLAQFRQQRDQAEQERKQYEAQQKEQPRTVNVQEAVNVVPEVKHPNEANGPKHSILGVMQEVKCSYPSVLELRVVGAKDSVTLYNNNFSKINLTVVGFTPKGSVNPCSDFNGMKARVQYAETTDKTVNGQVLAIELHK